jgi:pyruvate-formate lyase-activating enzyme
MRFPLDSTRETTYAKDRPQESRGRFCHAPTNNLFFGLNGHAFACPSAKIFPLGTFPDQSPLDIWRGARVNDLREHIAQNDLHLGCLGCFWRLSGSNYAGCPARGYDHLHEHRSHGYPRQLEFELENLCNLKCIMCSGHLSSAIQESRGQKPHLKEPYDDSFLEQITEFFPFLERVRFMGGEPFLIDRYYEITSQLWGKNPEAVVQITTNGTIVQPRVKDLLKKGPVAIALSLDAISQNVYETIRINADFQSVMENLTFFQNSCAEKQTSLCLVTAVMKQNWHDLPALVEFSNKRQIDIHFIVALVPAHCTLLNLPAQELKQICDHLARPTFPDDTWLYAANKKCYGDMLRELEWWYHLALIQQENAQKLRHWPKEHPEYLRRKTRLLLEQGVVAWISDAEDWTERFMDTLEWLLAQPDLQTDTGRVIQKMDEVVHPLFLEVILAEIQRDKRHRLVEYILSPDGIATLFRC